ncbi:MAG: phosphoglycerate kinase [Chthoniobacterales bacterium]
MKKRTIRDLSLQGKRVLIRVDFNVPQDKDTGEITNTQRIEAALPTIKHALDQGASVILMSHLGRPNGRRNEKFTLAPVATKLEELLGRPVKFLSDCTGPGVESQCAELAPGEVILLENLRFYIEEEGKAKDASGKTTQADEDETAQFRSSLTQLGDVYVNDAFGTSHRAHSSVVGVKLKDRVAGFLVEKELEAFAKVLDDPARPLLAILGGAKIADKIPLIRNLIDQADEIIVAGGMAYTFLSVTKGMKIGESLYDKEGAEIIPELLEKAKAKGVEIHLPVDFVTADDFSEKANTGHATVEDGIPDGWQGLDIGPKTREIFKAVIGNAKTIIWNGPPGVFEFDSFSGGSEAMAQAVADATATGATTIVGGGDTATAAKKFGVIDQVTHASTGGGASLELLEGKALPGVANLNDK